MAEAVALRFGGLFCVVINILVRSGIPSALVHYGEVGIARVFEAAFVGSAVGRAAYRHEMCPGIVCGVSLEQERIVDAGQGESQESEMVHGDKTVSKTRLQFKLGRVDANGG